MYLIRLSLSHENVHTANPISFGLLPFLKTHTWSALQSSDWKKILFSKILNSATLFIYAFCWSEKQTFQKHLLHFSPKKHTRYVFSFLKRLELLLNWARCKDVCSQSCKSFIYNSRRIFTGITFLACSLQKTKQNKETTENENKIYLKSTEKSSA